MCTGRTRPEIYPFLWEIGFRGLVGSNGAYGELDGETIFIDHMSAEAITEIAAWLDDAGADCFWQTGLALHPTRNFLDLFRPSSGSEQAITGDWSGFLDQIEPYLRDGIPETAAKVTFFLSNDTSVSLADAQEHFGEHFSVIAGSLPHSTGETGELTARGMNKSIGLGKIAAHLGVEVADTIALGDSANDIEMLAAAGTGVAMGNGTPEAKAAADWVTDSVDDGGLYSAFERLGLLDPHEG